MTLDQLTLFVAVFRAGSFIGAANDQNMSASALSRAISGLETELGARLFERTTRTLAPTDAGERLYTRAVALLEDADAAKADVRQSITEPSGKLRVTASTAFGQFALAPRLGAFVDRYPKIELDLILTDQRIDIIGNQIDLAIRHGQLADSSLVARKLRDVSYHLVASPSLLKKLPPISHPQDIIKAPLLAFNLEAFRSTWRFRKQTEQANIPIAPKVTATNAGALLELARSGAGIALLADWMLPSDLASGALINILEDWTASGTGDAPALWTIRPSRKWLPARVEAFAEFLTESFSTPKPY